MTDFKKVLYQRRIDKVADLKPVTIDINGEITTITSFEQIESMMDKALAEDLQTGDYSKLYTSKAANLKKAIYVAYLKYTNEFRNSIYPD